METTYHLTQEYAPPGVPLRILEKDAKTGQVVGEYVGYRNAQRGVFVLYPKYNKYALHNDRLHKHEVSERLVRFP